MAGIIDHQRSGIDYNSVGGFGIAQTDRHCHRLGQGGEQVSSKAGMICYEEQFDETFSMHFFRAVSSTTSTVFFPIFPWIFQVCIIGFAVVVGLYLASVGQPVNHIVKMSDDPNCRCSGPAVDYKVRYTRARCQILWPYLFIYFGLVHDLIAGRCHLRSAGVQCQLC